MHCCNDEYCQQLHFMHILHMQNVDELKVLNSITTIDEDQLHEYYASRQCTQLWRSTTKLENFKSEACHTSHHALHVFPKRRASSFHDYNNLKKVSFRSNSDRKLLVLTRMTNSLRMIVDTNGPIVLQLNHINCKPSL